MLVTAGSLFALAVVIAVSPNGPVGLWLDGGGSTVTLKERDGTTRAGARPDSPVGLLAGAPSPGVVSGVSLRSPVAATDRPGAVRLRANTRVQRRTAARTPATRRPSTPAPATSTPSPLQPVSQTTAGTPVAPVATPAPASTMNRTRGRGTAPSKTAVPKQRVQKQTAAPAPTAAPPTSGTPGPTPRSTPAPAPTLRPVQGGSQPSTGVGAADGVLHRVPPTHP